MDDKTEVLQIIKDGLSANPYFATHILLVVLETTSSSDFFCSEFPTIPVPPLSLLSKPARFSCFSASIWNLRPWQLRHNNYISQKHE